MDMVALVEAEALRKTLGPIVAVNGISLSVPKGEVLGFLGPNDCVFCLKTAVRGLRKGNPLKDYQV